jgi:hypothetical protein
MQPQRSLGQATQVSAMHVDVVTEVLFQYTDYTQVVIRTYSTASESRLKHLEGLVFASRGMCYM